MTGVTIEIEVQDEAVLAVFERLLSRVTDPSPALAEIGEYGVMSTRARIEEQNNDDPIEIWDALSTRYRQSKVKQAHHPDDILILYGELVSTLAWQADSASVGWGSNRVYAAAQQFGREEINLPARPFLGLTDRDTYAVLSIMERWLAAAV
ncbi:MAG: phage virion morphogenesis protein [Bradyrhizobium sp.]|nr:phage virion morphogenesis protein [Bradyrhizobium sp.]